MHYVLIWKFMVAAIKQLFFQPLLSVVAVRVNEQKVSQNVINLVLCYFIVNIFLILFGGIFMVAVDSMDLVSALSSVVAALMNIGPGWGVVGPTQNFATISDNLENGSYRSICL